MAKQLDVIMSEHNFTIDIDYSGSLGRSPSRTKINDVVAELTNGQVLDGKLPSNRRVLVFDDDDKCFLLIYIVDRDKWCYEKLTTR
jgi:hypothetical protein